MTAHLLIGMTKTKKTDIIGVGSRCGGTGNSKHCRWECKMINSHLGTHFISFLKR